MRRVYFGWYVVAAAVVATALLYGSTYSVFGLYVVPVSGELGLSRAEMNTSLIALNIGSAFFSPFLGRLLDRVSPRCVILASALLFGGSLTTLGLSKTLWLSAAVIAFPLALSIAGAGSLTMTVLVARWFAAQRGRAMTLAAIGNAVSGLLGAPAVSYLIAAYGWRHSLIISGAVGAVALIAIGLLLRDRPGDADARLRPLEFDYEGSPSQAQSSTPASVSELLRKPHLWTFGIASALAMCMSQAVGISLVPMAIEQNLSLTQAASLASIGGAASFFGKLLFSTIADKINRITILSGLYCLGGAANFAMLLDGGYPLLMMNAILLGICVGIHIPSFNALLADRFGANSFGTVRGVMVPISAIFGAASVRFAGTVYDQYGDYKVMFATFAGLYLVAAALMFGTGLLSPRPRPAAVGRWTT